MDKYTAELKLLMTQAVAAAVVTSELGVLIGRRADGTPPWAFPAGKIKPGESPEQTAVREVMRRQASWCGRPRSSASASTRRPGGRSCTWRPNQSTGPRCGWPHQPSWPRSGWVTLAEADDLLPGIFGPVRAYLGQTDR